MVGKSQIDDVFSEQKISEISFQNKLVKRRKGKVVTVTVTAVSRRTLIEWNTEYEHTVSSTREWACFK